MNARIQLLFLVLFCFFFTLRAQTKLGQSVVSTQFVLHQEVMKKGVKGVALELELDFRSFLQSFSEGKVAPDQFKLVFNLFQEEKEQVMAVNDCKAYQGANGVLQDSLFFHLNGNLDSSSRVELFLPYHAIDLPVGENKVVCNFRIFERGKKEVVGAGEKQVRIVKPAVRLFRFSIDKIEALSLEKDGEPWDYFIFKPSEKMPDIFWRLHRGREMLHRSSRQKNTLVYKGDADEDFTDWFFLSEGDSCTLFVMDHDKISFSDEIGRKKIGFWGEDLSGSNAIQDRFDRLPLVVYRKESRKAPVLFWSGLKSSFQAKESGVSGISFSFNYQIPNRDAGTSYFLRYNQESLGDRVLPHYVRVISGPAIQRENGQLELLSRQGEVKLFFPYYGLGSRSEDGAPAWLNFELIGNMDGEAYPLKSHRFEIRYNFSQLQDINFGQWKAGAQMMNGQSGILISCDYSLPKAYLADKPEAEFRIQASLTANGKQIEVKPSWLDRKGQSSSLNEDPGGTVYLFLPYSHMNYNDKTAHCDLKYLCEMVEGEKVTNLGRLNVTQDIPLGNFRVFEFYVEEVQVKRKALINGKAQLRWLIELGGQVVYKSSLIRNAKSGQWTKSESIDLVLAEEDEISIVIVDDLGNNQFLTLGRWTGLASDLPETGKSLRFKPEGLKRLILGSGK